MLGGGITNGPNLFHFVLIKPTHYDDDGYPIQWSGRQFRRTRSHA